MPGGPTRISRETLAMPMARLGAPSNLPRFRWQQPTPNRPTPPDVGLTAEESAHGFAWGADSILPYQVAEDYDRVIRDGMLDVIVIDNGRLRALVAPTLGGRLLELKELPSGRHLVYRNPVFQPANLASLNAWFSGGIEWNGLIPGHSPFTCAPVFAGTRETPQGPILRLYEFDRIVEATWQVDLFLPADGDVLYAHGRIVNPGPEPRLAYWWTNIAAPLRRHTRVLSPADDSIEHLWPGNNLGRQPFPRPDRDASYPDDWEDATSVFFRAPGAPRLFIASVDGEGCGLLQTATAEMRGRKFFYFGTAAGGQNWMDYLSRPGEGAYLEIQSGITPTQNQRFVLAPNAELEWTEAFVPLQLDAAAAHDPDYAAAVAHAAEALDRIVPVETLAQVDAFLRAEARQPLETRLAPGSPWGMRQERLSGRRLAEGLDFGVEARGDWWDELADAVQVSETNLRDVPDGIAVSRLWTDRIEASAAAMGTSWLHALMLGIAHLDRGDVAAARHDIERSLALRPTWLGYRMQALLSADADAASENYLRAWSIGGGPPELATEIATHFMAAGRPAELKAFVEALPPAIGDNERIVLARAVVAAQDGRFDEAEQLLMSRRFATIREGETVLSDLWTKLRRGRLEARLGRVATADEVRLELADHPLPSVLDLRMHALEET